ncbi:hypothetical protein AGMMS50256_08200 [Betaproteobacteria bacterium]|nr:hypothetical protein AGMMS50256_08200 [Betaproteobacteria bacterium]
MSMTFPLYVFDASRHRDILPLPVEDVESVQQAIEQLKDVEVGENPRFERLGWYLGRQAPAVDQFNYPLKWEERLRSWIHAVWQHNFEEPEEITGFLKILLPLTWGLRLDVYDETTGIYIPAERPPLPYEEGIAFLHEFYPEVRDVKRFPSDEALTDRFHELLSAPLGEHGFVFEDKVPAEVLFSRHIDGNRQEISVSVSEKSRGVFLADAYLESKSERLATIHDEYHPFLFGGIYVEDIQKINQPVWNIVPGIDWATSEIEVEWRVADWLRYGLPVLEQARTVGGMDRLFNDKGGIADFFRNKLSWGTRSFVPQMQDFDVSSAYKTARCATIYARLAGNPELDSIVHYIEQCFAGWKDERKRTLLQEIYAGCVRVCRSQLKPVGKDAPA